MKEHHIPRILWGDAVEVQNIADRLVVLGNERKNFLNIETSSPMGMCRAVLKKDVIGIWRMGVKIWGKDEQA